MSIGLTSSWHGRMGPVPVCIAALSLASCVGADRTGARRIADTGIGIATALADEVATRQRRLRDAVADDSFNVAYAMMGKCTASGGITRLGPAAAVPDCDVIQLAAARRQGGLQRSAGDLAAIVARRAGAAAALGDAYRVFATEADYDAVADMEDAIGRATGAVNGFAAAVGLGPLTPVVGAAVRMAAGLGADRAQKRRLLAANDALRAVSLQMRAALLRERDRHRAIEGIVATLDADTRINLVRAGLLDTRFVIDGIGDRVGLPIVAEVEVRTAMARDPALAAAAEVVTLVRLPDRAADPLDAAIGALAVLDGQHAAYARGRPVAARDAAAALSRLAVVARAGGEGEKRP